MLLPVNENTGKGSQVTQLAIFKQIWILSSKQSFVSGLYLRDFMKTDLFLNCFAHVLPKAKNKYPYFKYYAGNIVLLTPGEHSLWDHGTEEARISYSLDLKEQSGGRIEPDWEKLKAREGELIKLYKKKFPTTRGLIIGYKYSPEEVIKVVGKLNREFFKALADPKKDPYK